MNLNPQFDALEIINHIDELTEQSGPTPHAEILNKLIDQFEPLDFLLLAFPQIAELKKQLKKLDPESNQAKDIRTQLLMFKLINKHYLIISIENVLNVAEKNRWGLCKNHDFIYLYNDTYWANIDKEEFQKFLGESSEKMGVTKYTARYYQFRDQLFKQFLSTAYLPTPEPPKDVVFINLKNGTFEVTPNGTKLRSFNRSDFLTYQLQFDYNPEAKAPIFQRFLNEVLPDKQRQKILAEYLGFVFIKHGSNSFKEEKALILLGTGANGKSVFYEVVSALLGSENTSNFSLQSLTDVNGYYRAMISDKLVNYASEINSKLEASTFKQMVSGEPVEARLPYGKPFMLKQYAKLIFNTNELPRDVEHTNAYFRRFLIIPFEVTIPEERQDKQLHLKIIDKELSGVFNWVLEGLNRLLAQKRFTHSDAVKKAVEQYKNQSDSVKLFIDVNEYTNSPDQFILIKDLYPEYRIFCIDDGYKPVNKTNFIKRLRAFNVVVERKNTGNVAYLATTANIL